MEKLNIVFLHESKNYHSVIETWLSKLGEVQIFSDRSQFEDYLDRNPEQVAIIDLKTWRSGGIESLSEFIVSKGDGHKIYALGGPEVSVEEKLSMYKKGLKHLFHIPLSREEVIDELGSGINT